jgi:guanylate kinase
MKIYFLVGQSCTGKDTILAKVRKILNIDLIVTSTTRPMREGEIDGVTYHFMTEEEFQLAKRNDSVVEDRAYNTVAGLWRYFTTTKNLDADKNYICVGTINQCTSYTKYFGVGVVRPIKIIVSDYDRLMRGITRELSNKQNFKEVARRFLDEFDEFTDENYSRINFILEVKNDVLDECCDTIVRRIKEDMLEFKKDKYFTYNINYFDYIVNNHIQLEADKLQEILDYLKKYKDSNMLAEDYYKILAN